MSNVPFTWTSIPNAAGYEIQIDTAPTFDTPSLISQTTTSASYSHTFTALGARYWRVRALPNGGYSSIWRFVIATPLTQVTAAAQDDFDPTLLQAADGKLWVVWHSYRSGNADLWYKTSSDNGATWSTDTQLTTDTSMHYAPALAQSSAGKLWLAWFSYRSDNYDLWYKTFDVKYYALTV